jgi:hypothetical protein
MSELRDLIREVADEHPQAQPEEIASDVAKLTSADHLIQFYEEALRPYVVMLLSRDRNTAIDNARNESTGEQSGEDAPTTRKPARSKKAERAGVGLGVTCPRLIILLSGREVVDGVARAMGTEGLGGVDRVKTEILLRLSRGKRANHTAWGDADIPGSAVVVRIGAGHSRERHRQCSSGDHGDD